MISTSALRERVRRPVHDARCARACRCRRPRASSSLRARAPRGSNRPAGAANLVAAVALDDERDAGLIDRHLVDRDIRVAPSGETSRARSPCGASAIRYRRESPAPTSATGGGDAGDRPVVVDASSSTSVPRSLCKPFIAYARAGAPRVLRRFVVHHFRAVLGELGHLGERGALDRARVRDAPRVGRHRAADVGVDVDAPRLQRVADRDGREVGAAAPERRDDAVFRRALKAGDDRNRAALQQLARSPAARRAESSRRRGARR